mmetsp:Transcript_40122/g.76698  ORF Transcript_40122/g.76698 Transcript_40122/m.76698 type:complete len:137 (-) Transcript_40122:403-813(-)
MSAALGQHLCARKAHTSEPEIDASEEKRIRERLLRVKMRRSATIIQAYWRGMVTRIALTKWRLIRKRAAVNIQASVRGWIVRRNPAIQEALAHARLRKHAAATKIQALWRGAIARSRYRVTCALTFLNTFYAALLS